MEFEHCQTVSTEPCERDQCVKFQQHVLKLNRCAMTPKRIRILESAGISLLHRQETVRSEVLLIMMEICSGHEQRSSPRHGAHRAMGQGGQAASAEPENPPEDDA